MNDEQLRQWERNSGWYKKLEKMFTDDVFRNNEISANIFVGVCLLVLVGVLLISFLLTYVGVFEVPLRLMSMLLYVNIPIILLALAISYRLKWQKHWIKYMLCIVSLFTALGMHSIISIFVPIMLCIPVVLSARYYSRRFTNTVYSLTVAGMVVSEFVYARIGMLDMNLVDTVPGTILTIGEGGLREAMTAFGYDSGAYVLNLFRGSFMPHWLLLSIVAFICQELARRAGEMVISQAEISKKTESVKAELDMATNIQVAVLPKIFPAFPARPDLDIRASMDPAKEVGGDFYDYYLLDDDHLMLVMADVSGKGVPAALFMMISKILIKTHAYIDRSPAKIAKAVNQQLCEGNDAEMFVTAWIGVLEMSTGIITAVDAGHEYPAVRRANGDYELIRGKKSFILAGMEVANYREYSFEFKRGDRLFLYTDGVPEATNSENKLFGIERMMKVLNSNKESSPEELLKTVRAEVDAFVGGAPQFDDLTMLALHFKEIE